MLHFTVSPFLSMTLERNKLQALWYRRGYGSRILTLEEQSGDMRQVGLKTDSNSDHYRVIRFNLSDAQYSY